MKKIDVDLIKDIIISVLLVIAIVLVVIIILYNKTGLIKIIPEVEKYKMSEKMEKELNETVEEEQNTVVTYKIDATDLKNAEKSREYDKGKKNPFAYQSEGIEGVITGNNPIQNQTGNFFFFVGTK